ncbi:hypothetical protein HETIRDRAFT_152365 [Heterobasidion irregulare TC 32-1]|uniref:SEC7 domain-containing protein n=1 Tax=Heterobasidion irregulare (strain TC 32-1) TaxID=747525 RepID=W4JV47_HETIT|nr:uncharacterized protein HETIRDRAFT_152365 [Heterobasidion irregulare TC 32-1]ETW76955.1 hypothetical protein HETIRDRAFT_152365 [Heterobasidion irregulare TC 32-1]
MLVSQYLFRLRDPSSTPYPRGTNLSLPDPVSVLVHAYAPAHPRLFPLRHHDVGRGGHRDRLSVKHDDNEDHTDNHDDSDNDHAEERRWRKDKLGRERARTTRISMSPSSDAAIQELAARPAPAWGQPQLPRAPPPSSQLSSTDASRTIDTHTAFSPFMATPSSASLARPATRSSRPPALTASPSSSPTPSLSRPGLPNTHPPIPAPVPGSGPSHSTSSASQSNLPPPSLVDLVVHTTTTCHTESTADSVRLQVVKALLALVLSSTILVHQSSLLKAVRTVYNIFLMADDAPSAKRDSFAPSTPDIEPPRALPSQDKVPSADDISLEIPLPLLPLVAAHDDLPVLELPSSNGIEHGVDRPDTPHAWVSLAQFRLCPLFTVLHASELSPEHPSPGASCSPGTHDDDQRPLPQGCLPRLPIHVQAHNEAPQLGKVRSLLLAPHPHHPLLIPAPARPAHNEHDLKSHSMRSKLLSLHMVLVIFNAHMDVFVSPSSLIHSSSSHEATPLSRKAASPVPQVFEISVEIFWRVITGLRTKLKKEIEVPFYEIFFPILEMKTSTLKQKAAILGMLPRLCHDPQALVEIYLNYDCDSQVADNIYEHLMNIITKIGTSTLPSAAQQKPADPASPTLIPTSKAYAPGIPPSLVTSAVAVSGSLDTSALGHSEQQLCRQSLECLTAVLRSLVAWGTAPDSALAAAAAGAWCASVGEDGCPEGLTPDASQSLDRLPTGGPSAEATRQPTPDIHDDPGRFESAKQKKTMLLEGVKKFNLKPKRVRVFFGRRGLTDGRVLGHTTFARDGFILSKAPQDVARFLLHINGLSKSMIGEYLGEGDEENIATMYTFVNMLDLRNMPFVDALRVYLQAFRLPGEAQKIDRFMLKFAERYIEGNANTPFANADAYTAYVISYSVILLNTDAHNPQVKKRMTRADFVKNNRGINEGADLPEELLSAIFDDIVNNGIRIKDEVDSSLVVSLAPGAGLASALATVGQDLQREAYMLQSNGMVNKTKRRDVGAGVVCSRVGYAGAVQDDDAVLVQGFAERRAVLQRVEVAWIPFLAGISGPLQETDNLDVVELCLDGFRNAIRIVCFFDLELERNAFVTTLAKFTFLNNLGEMKTKNMEAAQTLLDVTVMEGNNLKGSWREVLSRTRKLPNEELANESRSTHITVAADMVLVPLGYIMRDFTHSYLAAFQVSTQSIGLARSHGALYVVSNTTAQATRYFSRRLSLSLQEPFALQLSMPSVSQECLNALASRVKSSLKLLRTLKVQQAAAQSTISMLKSKVSSLGSLAQAS